jgi:serine/threonine protein kinase, bacterial
MLQTIIANRYQVIRELSSGGFGETFLAEDTQIPSRRQCVIKQLKPVTHNPEIHQLVKERFQREAITLEELGNTNEQIPTLYAYFSEGDQFYLVQEWIEGETLFALTQQQKLLSEDVVKEILIKLLPVISYVHSKGIVHRDINPANIMLRKQSQQPVLIDFGAVKETMGVVINTQGNSSRSIVIGTPGYMPPEQTAGRPVFASDLYSLGLTAIYLLTGKPPDLLDTDPANGEIKWQSPEISANFAAVINRSIQIHTRDRFASAQEMLTALQSSILPATTIIPLGHFSNLKTVVVSPANSNFTEQPHQITDKNNSSKLLPVLLGSLVIGLSIIGGILVLRSSQPVTVVVQQTPAISPPPVPVQPTVSPPPTRDRNSTSTATAVISPPLANNQINNRPITTPAPKVINSVSPNSTVIGEPGSKNIRSEPGSGYGVVAQVNVGDRLLVTGQEQESNGFIWYKIYDPQSGVEGWIANHLINIDGTNISSTPPIRDTTNVVNTTNATIVGKPGSKNIRSGPGTQYSSLHIAYPGDRIKIIESASDQGGYTWYKVYFPESGASGWIAAQLINLD